MPRSAAGKRKKREVEGKRSVPAKRMLPAKSVLSMAEIRIGVRTKRCIRRSVRRVIAVVETVVLHAAPSVPSTGTSTLMRMAFRAVPMRESHITRRACPKPIIPIETV